MIFAYMFTVLFAEVMVCTNMFTELFGVMLQFDFFATVAVLYINMFHGFCVLICFWFALQNFIVAVVVLCINMFTVGVYSYKLTQMGVCL
jgi:hypothetical protein